MKLWQKIFLISLVILTAAIDTVSYFLADNSFRTTLSREKNHAVRMHSVARGEIENLVAYTRLNENKILLSESDTKAVIQTYLAKESTQENIVRCFDADEQEVLAEGEQPAQDVDKNAFQNSTENQYLQSIKQDGEQYYVQTTSSLTLDGTLFWIQTDYAVTQVYQLRSEQLHTAGIASVAVSAAAATILLLTTLFLLKPLARTNRALRKIAGGDYRVRLKETSSAEFRELSKNLNAMSAAIGTNVEKLEKIAEDRRIFIANLAHEMKTPLTSIMGFGDILRVKKRVSEKELREYAGIIVEETKRLRGLSGKLMELISVGSMQIERKPLALRELLYNIGTVLTPILLSHELSLTCRPVDCEIFADEELIKSLLMNLTDNAMKASAAGGEVRILCKDLPETGRVEIAVCDDGIGMSQKDAERAMEPFYMADKSRTRKAGGAGLGLALCAEIARIHGGLLTIESEKNKGTTVRFSVERKGALQ